MWIGTIKVFLQTKDGRFVATQTSVQPAIERNGNRLKVFGAPRPLREYLNWPLQHR
jgi:hypothetical protein